MRIDRCKGCGEHVNIANDHAPGCTRNAISQVIPGAAVEAALSALLPDSDLESLRGGWWWGNVETILEAAAPHMLNPPPPISEGPSEGADAVTGFPRAAYRKRRMG